MFVVAVLIIVLFITLFLMGIQREQGLINTFRDNEILDSETAVQNTDDFVNYVELTLINLDFLPSYRGEYQSLLFNNKFQMECY